MTEVRTIAIDTVASAKGSPSILSMLIDRIPPALLPLPSMPPFILRRDGECSDPYDGIGTTGRSFLKLELKGNYREASFKSVDSIDR